MTRVGMTEVRVVGDLDGEAAQELSSLLQSVQIGPQGLTVDLREANYLDSVAVAVLYQHVRRGLRILAREDSAVATVLRICGLAAVARLEFRSA